MNNHIDILLEKYWDATTSLQEEERLKAYFNGDNVATHHEQLRPLFAHFNHMKAQVTDTELPKLILEDQSGGKVRTLALTKWIPRVAAIMVLFLASVVLFKDQVNPSEHKQYAGKVTTLDNVNDAGETEDAMEITMEALAFLTSKLNKNATTIRTHVKSVERADIFKN